ncbi:MAG: hypothetical protein ACOYKN_11245 [Pirellula sp.]
MLSEWLTVPVRFDNAILRVLKEMGGPVAVEARWGRDMRSDFENACRSAEILLDVENPLNAKLREIFQSLREQERSFRIFCHRRSREHFESIYTASSGVPIPENVFIHSVAQYREVDLFSVLVKVGPLRSKGWGAAPDALLTAPRFDTLIQVVWSGCNDEPGFGYDPVSAVCSEVDTSQEAGATINRDVQTLGIKWKIQETRSRDNTVGRHDHFPDNDEFQLFANLGQCAELQRATLVQVNEEYGILYPCLSPVFGLDPVTNSVDYRLPGETLLEGMYLILPLVDDVRLAGLQAEDGHFSTLWKEKLRTEFQINPAAIENRLWNAGLELLNLRGRIAHWCKPPTTVIHAPQRMDHFEILVRVLGLDFDVDETAKGRKAAWWQYAWNEVRRARGEAIQTGVQEQQIVDGQVMAALLAIAPDIRKNVNQRMFQLAIPSDQPIHGAMRFYKVVAIEDGFRAPPGELRMLCELSRIDQWRA